MREGTIHVFPHEQKDKRMILSSLDPFGSRVEAPIRRYAQSYTLNNGAVRVFMYVYDCYLSPDAAREIARYVVSQKAYLKNNEVADCRQHS